jgi:hypothetical protein
MARRVGSEIAEMMESKVAATDSEPFGSLLHGADGKSNSSRNYRFAGILKSLLHWSKIVRYGLTEARPRCGFIATHNMTTLGVESQ